MPFEPADIAWKGQMGMVCERCGLRLGVHACNDSCPDELESWGVVGHQYYDSFLAAKSFVEKKPASVWVVGPLAIRKARP